MTPDMDDTGPPAQDRRLPQMGGPNTHRTMILVAATLQTISMFDFEWIKYVRAGLLSLSGVLLLLAKTSTAIGRREGDTP